MKKENFTVEELLEALRNTDNATKEVQEDIIEIDTRLDKDKRYNFVVLETEQEIFTDYALVMSNEALKNYEIESEDFTDWVCESLLTKRIKAKKSWSPKSIETSEILFLQDKTLELLFNTNQ